MTTAKITVCDERLWRTKDSLYGSRIVRVAESLYRARIERNAYDVQSRGVVETWCVANGWKEVQTVPIEALPVASTSYVAKPAEWRPKMQESLEALVELGRHIFAAGE